MPKCKFDNNNSKKMVEILSKSIMRMLLDNVIVDSTRGLFTQSVSKRILTLSQLSNHFLPSYYHNAAKSCSDSLPLKIV